MHVITACVIAVAMDACVIAVAMDACVIAVAANKHSLRKDLKWTFKRSVLQHYNKNKLYVA